MYMEKDLGGGGWGEVGGIDGGIHILRFASF